MAARLAGLVHKARAAAEPALAKLSSETAKQYESVMAKNAEYVVKDPEAANKLLKQYVFTQMARIPTGMAQCRQEANVMKTKWAILRDLPATEVATCVGFAAELYAWFCIGEIVGRGGSLTGYNV